MATGIVDTDVNASGLGADLETEANAASLHTLDRVGQPVDMADVVVFLAPDDAHWVAGGVVDPTGGRRSVSAVSRPRDRRRRDVPPCR